MNRRHIFTLAALSSAACLFPAAHLLASDLSPHEQPFEAAPVGLPAVSGVNWKLDAFGGAYEDGSIAGGEAAVSLPLGYHYGMQIDGVAASLDDRFFGSLSDHIFWRDPTRALLGLYGSYAHYDGFGGTDEYHLGVEGELYRGNVTLRALAGVEGGDADTATINGVPFNFDIATRFFDKVDLIYYPREDLKLFIGHRYTGGVHAAAAGAEYLWRQEGGRATSTFVESRLGEDDSAAVWAGLRFYFGNSDKSLMRRHREDDPNLWEPDTHLGISAKLNQTPPEGLGPGPGPG